MSENEPRPQAEGAARPEGRVRQFRHGFVRGLALAAAVLFVVFAVANSQRVDFHWLVGASEVTTSGGGVPLILLLSGAFVLGAVVGGALMALRHRRREPAG